MRWPRLPGMNWLDFKLAVRMLVRHRGLTLVGGLAMAIGIPISLAPIQLADALNATLPFEEGERILGLQYYEHGNERRASLGDFERWKTELTSFESLAAARRRVENVIGDGGLVEVVRGAEVTTSALAIPRVQPILGRTVMDADQIDGAPPVVVIGYDLWQSQFHRAADVLGRTLRFGRTVRTVVGVMPEGYLFPARDHFWIPIQAQSRDYAFGEGPRFWVFGRLRDDMTAEQALAEFAALGQRIAAEHHETHGTVRAEVIPYAHAITGLRPTADRMYVLYAMCLMLLAVACGNVGTLMLARTAARSNEIAVRNALGAGRARIVMQLFLEALVLSVASGALGLALADQMISRLSIVQRFESVMPFWFDLSVKPFTVMVAGSFAVFCAVIAGLLPALKITGKRAYHSLQRQAAGGAGLRFGAAATLLIVAEVAVAVACLSGVSSVARGAFRPRSVGDGIAAEEFLTSEMTLPPPDRRALITTDGARAAAARMGRIQEELSRRLLSEPDVRAVSFANVLPGMLHGRGRVDVDGDVASSDESRVRIVNVAFVERGFFETLGQRPLLGRTFDTRDVVPRGRPVIVNRSFVDKVLRGRHPIGERIRFLRPSPQPPTPWVEIIGVVEDLGMNIVDPEKSAGVYHLVVPGELGAPQLLIRVHGDASSFVARLRTILAAIEPGMVLDNPERLDRVFSEMLWQAQFSAVVFTLIAIIAVVLSSAGLYALMSFTISQRTREIAIRIALGARPSRIVGGVLSRALLQLVAGVALGSTLAVFLVPEILNSFTLVEHWRQMLIVVSCVMIAAGLLACASPIRRAIGIQPVEALKEI